MRLIDPDESSARATVPLVGMAQAGAGRLFSDDGMPTGGPGWGGRRLSGPAAGRSGSSPFEVQGDSMRPLYREGDIVIVSRTVTIRRGDRVVVRTRGGEVMAKELKRRTARLVEADLAQSGPSGPHRARVRDRLDGPHHVGTPVTPQRGASPYRRPPSLGSFSAMPKVRSRHSISAQMSEGAIADSAHNTARL